MPNFSIIIAYMDGKNSFRRRNLYAVLDRCLALFSDAEIIIAEQGSSSISDKLNNYNERVRRIELAEGSRFHKTKLLNMAIESATTDTIVMMDADAYIDDVAAKSIEAGLELLKTPEVGIVYPFNEVDYLSEGQTRSFLGGIQINSKFCFHGVHIQRQTGLCNMYLKSTWERVNGFDEEFYEWGAEDDAFTYKIKRLVGVLKRTEGHVYHLFHPQVNTEAYQKSSVYTTNRKLCACIRRMTADDLESYIAGKVTLSSLMEKYEKQRRLNVRLSWACTKQTVLTIDTTIYDLDYETEMSFTKILDAVLLEDGPAYIPTFVNEVFYSIPDLSPDQKAEIDAFVEKAKRLAEIEAK